jgi:hypothetical protein
LTARRIDPNGANLSHRHQTIALSLKTPRCLLGSLRQDHSENRPEFTAFLMGKKSGQKTEALWQCGVPVFFQKITAPILFGNSGVRQLRFMTERKN